MSYAAQAHAQAIAQLGYESHVMCPASAGTSTIDVEPPNDDGIVLHRVNVAGSGLMWNPISGDLDAIERYIQELNPDVVIAEGWYSWGSYLLGRMSKGRMKFVIFSHGSSPVTRSLQPANLMKAFGYLLYEKSIQKSILQNLDGALLLSKHKDNRRFSDWKLFEKLSIPMTFCANTSIFPSDQMRPKEAVRPYVLTNIGEMSKNKNQLLAVEVARKLSKKLPIHLRFIYPAENSYSKEVRKMVASLRMEESVSYIVGCERKSLMDIVSGSSIILVVSYTEAQPLVVIDGLALGVPFVSTDVGCLRSMSGGVVSEAKNLDKELESVLSDPGIYSRLSLDALNYYKEFCDPSVTMGSLKKALDTI
jgi:glycosyltransferase involved in cell wall biosynthesis